MTKEELVEMFRKEVHEPCAESEDFMDVHWGDMTLGFFLGKGLSPEDAWDLALHVRYHTPWG